MLHRQVLLSPSVVLRAVWVSVGVVIFPYSGIKENLGVLTWLQMGLCQLLCSNWLLMHFLQLASFKFFQILEKYILLFVPNQQCILMA